MDRSLEKLLSELGPADGWKDAKVFQKAHGRGASEKSAHREAAQQTWVVDVGTRAVTITQGEATVLERHFKRLGLMK